MVSKLLYPNLNRYEKVRFWYGGNPYYTDSYHSSAKEANARRRELRKHGFRTRLETTYRFKGMVTVPQTKAGKTWHLYVAKDWKKM